MNPIPAPNSQWRPVTLGELIRVKHGFAFKGEYFSDSGSYVVLTPGNFFERGGFRFRPSKERYYTENPPNDYVLDKDDLVVAMTEQGAGLLGSSALIPETGVFLHNQRLGRIFVNDELELDKHYQYHLFNSPTVRGQISGSATGTKVRHTAPERIYRVKVYLPGISTQKAIAEILDSYERLILLAGQQVELLEKAARLIYREWFVRFRFPGYEHVELEAGIPKGWRKAPLGTLVAIRKGKNITKETAVEGEVPVVAGGLQPAYFHNTANVPGPAVTVSASGANAGFVNLYHTDIWASDCSYISSDATPYVHFFFLLLRDRHSEIHAMQKGAAQPHVYPKDLERLVVLYPSDALLQEFADLVAPVFRQIRVLQDQSRRLGEAGNLLLPRLMSGEIEV